MKVQLLQRGGSVEAYQCCAAHVYDLSEPWSTGDTKKVFLKDLEKNARDYSTLILVVGGGQHFARKILNSLWQIKFWNKVYAFPVTKTAHGGTVWIVKRR